VKPFWKRPSSSSQVSKKRKKKDHQKLMLAKNRLTHRIENNAPKSTITLKRKEAPSNGQGKRLLGIQQKTGINEPRGKETERLGDGGKGPHWGERKKEKNCSLEGGILK